MIYCKELNTSYNNKKELFKALKENKQLIVDSKKSKIYQGIEKGLSLKTKQESIIKTLDTIKDINIDSNYYYFVVNSSNILDTHMDVHLDKNWEKTIKEQQGKVYLVFDHELKRDEIIAMKEDIEMFTAYIPFSSLGFDYEGQSYCLIYKVKKDKIVNLQAKDWLEKGYSFEASVRMQYMDIVMCLDSDHEDDKKEKENFDKYYPEIANKKEFENIYYFWAVKQAKNVYESSLVMFGSNHVTGLITEDQEEKNEPSKDTQNKEAAESTSNLLNIYQNFKF